MALSSFHDCAAVFSVETLEHFPLVCHQDEPENTGQDKQPSPLSWYLLTSFLDRSATATVKKNLGVTYMSNNINKIIHILVLKPRLPK